MPLLRSDWAVAAFNPSGAIGQQCQTYGLSLWMPYHGTGAPLSDDYTMRSAFAPAYRIGWDTQAKDIDQTLLHRVVDNFRQVEPYLLDDFYPLTPYSLEHNVWMAWQYDRPELGEGIVQVFRRAESVDESTRLKLRGLEPASQYEFTDLDSGHLQRITGRELLEQGLLVQAPRQPSALLFRYQKMP